MLKRLPIIIFLFIIFYIYFKEEVFKEKTLIVGASLPNTGIIKSWGESVSNGVNAYFSYANDNNLIKNKKIEFLVYDDKYEPELTYENTQKLVYENKVFALFGFVGTPTIKRVLPILYDENIPFFSAFSGASFLRNNKNQNFINFRSSYDQEIDNLINYLNDEKKLNKIAVFYAGETIEIANKEDFSGQGENLKHPYTKALWRALPENDFVPLIGNQPQINESISGCAFSPRCPIATDLCREKKPESSWVNNTMIRCFYARN